MSGSLLKGEIRLHKVLRVVGWSSDDHSDSVLSENVLRPFPHPTRDHEAGAIGV